MKEINTDLPIAKELESLKENDKWVIPTFLQLLQNGVEEQIITPNQYSLFQKHISEKISKK